MSKRLVEWIKSLAIVCLTISAAWLVTLSPLYEGSSLEERVEGLFSPGETGAGSGALSLTAAARPMSVAVMAEEGRYGAQYDEAATGAVFDALGPLLGEALSGAGEPSAIGHGSWRSALARPGVYLDFNAAIPLPALSAWLKGEEGSAPAVAVRRLALAAGTGEGDVWLYWQEAEGGLFACATGLDRTLQLLPNLSAWLPNSAFFAFEDGRYSACDPYTLITDVPAPAVYAGAVSLSNADPAAVERALEALSYSTASGSSYAIIGGTRYTDGVSNFQLTDTGELTYHAAGAGIPVAGEGEEPTLARCIEASRRLAEDTLGRLCGAARLTLLLAEEEGGRTVVTFGYTLDGVPVLLHQEGWAARFEVTGGSIASFTLHFRSYSPTGETTLLLPELQAAAALSATEGAGDGLLLAYLDAGGSTVSAGWIAG